MTSSEKKIEKKLRVGIEKLGGLCLKFPATFFAGIPDRLCILKGGLVFFVETKGEGLKPTPRQLVVAKKLESLGVRVYVANSEALVEDLLSSCEAVYTTAKAGFTEKEAAELQELQAAREGIRGFDSTDDLNNVDLARYYALKAKQSFYNQP